MTPGRLVTFQRRPHTQENLNSTSEFDGSKTKKNETQTWVGSEVRVWKLDIGGVWGMGV